MAYRFFPILTLAQDTPYHPADPDEPQTSRLAWRGAWLALFALIPFLPSLRGGPIWLDEPLVFRNPALKTAAGLGQIWFHPRASTEYHPAAATAMWLEYHAFGSRAFGYHAISLALHVTGVLLLWLVLRRLAVPGAWLAAAAFGAHPLAIQSVAWISRQENVLGTVAFLASLLTALRFFEVEPAAPEDYLDQYPEPRRAAYAASLVLFAVAALCVPAAAVAPVILALILWWKRGTVGRDQWISLAPMCAIGVSIVGLETWLWATADAASDIRLTAVQRLALAPMIFCFYGFKSLVPYPALFVYPRWAIQVWQGASCAAAILLAAAGLSWWAVRRPYGLARGAIAAAVLFVACLVPALGGWRGEGTTFAYAADFFAYPAMLGIIVPGIAALVYAVSRQPRFVPTIRLSLGTVLLAGLITLTTLQSRPYDDEARLWRWTIARGGASPIAYERLGVTLLDRGDGAPALTALRKGRELDPSSARAATYLGLAYETLGRWDEAIWEYRQALATNPPNADVYVRLAGAYARLGNLPEAEANYRAALKLRPKDPAVHTSLGLVLVLGGKLADGIDEYNDALDINPHLASARINLADAEYRRGNFDIAASELQKVINEDPQHPNYEALMNAGFILHQHREYAKAEQMFKVAVEVNPRSPEAHNALGMVQAAQARLDEAVLNFEQALDLNPNFEDARRNLEAARKQRGR